MLAIVAGIATFQIAKATVGAKEFEGQIRGIILSNPMMPDPEVAERLAAAARKSGVTHDPASLSVERQGAAGTISRIRVRYEYPVLLGWRRSGQAAVSP